MSLRAGGREGLSTITPLLLPTATVALAVGVAAPAAGLSLAQTVAMSVAVYFPSVMLAALNLLTAGVPVAVVVLTALVVGVRVVILSLSIAPYFRDLSTRWKWGLAYFLWTPVYALTVERFETDPTADVRGYYLGMAVPLWLTVQLFVGVGFAFSANVPPGLDLEFIIPLAFISLLVNFLSDEATTAAAIFGGVVAVVGAGLPFGLGVVAATLCGVLAGVLVSRWRRST